MEVSVANADSLHADDLPTYNVVFINDVPRLSRRCRATACGSAQDRTAGAICHSWRICGSGLVEQLCRLPVKPIQKITATRNLGKPSVSITSFDRNHGIFKKFQNSANFTLNTAQFFAYTQMELNPGATALAKFEDGSPAMAEFSGQDRGLVVFASSVDNAVPSGWNDFPLKASFVPMFIEVVRYLSHSSEIREWYALGEGIPVVGAWLAELLR